MSMKMKKLPLGVSDFKDMVTGEYYYVDKTLFIKDILDKGDKILLIPRPRRFGKTLNLSMLGCFYDCCPAGGAPGTGAANSYKNLFHNLAITKAGKEYLDKMGKYPVIFLTFKNIKELNWETAYRKIKKLILRVSMRVIGEEEKVYHAFVMGLLLWLGTGYQVKSNRESGYGRYDIMIIPQEKSKLGFIIEFKKTRKKETLEAAVKSALEQIENKKYETELLQSGIKNYKKLAIVFKGKEVTVKEG